MWDEKKFFEDFVKESDRVKADEAFVRELKELEHRKERTFPYVKYAVSIAAAAACIGIGVFALHSGGAGNPTNPSVIEENAGILAGEDTGKIESGSIGLNKDNIGDRVRSELEKSSTIVTDSEGKELSGEQRTQLLQLLENAVFVENELEDGYTWYSCEGDSAFEIRIIETAGEIKASVTYR